MLQEIGGAMFLEVTMMYPRNACTEFVELGKRAIGLVNIVKILEYRDCII